MSLEVLHLQLISAVLTKLLTWDFGYKTPRHIQILNDYCGPFAYLLYFHAKFSSYFPHTKENCFPFSFSIKFSLYYFFLECLSKAEVWVASEGRFVFFFLR